MNNVLADALIHAAPCGKLNLGGILAALARNEVDSFPALRPHQAPAWHMFLVQLAALALLTCRVSTIPQTESDWTAALRNLTAGFDADEPWRLVVDDQSKPAFLQSPVPEDVTLKNVVASPDALDLLITAKNHDLKRSVGRDSRAEDWIFALVSLQTGEGYGGRGNHGIARMNGGSSSRATVTLAPLPQNGSKTMTPRPGARFRRDVAVLIETREQEFRSHDHLGYAESGGIGLTWLASWPEDDQLQIKALDIWFIEVCRRIRLCRDGDSLIARKGTSKATRINAKHLKGVLGDPFAPVNTTESKSLTLGSRDFDYRLLTDLLLSGDWTMPVLARPGRQDQDGNTMALVVEALSRGNSRTDGFKSRILPLGGQISRVLGAHRKRLHELARQQMGEIDVFSKAIGFGLALVGAGGDRDRVRKEHYSHAGIARNRFDRAVNALFFDHLWRRFEAQELGDVALDAAKGEFVVELFATANEIFEFSLPAVPCAGIFRERARARARSAFFASIRREFPELLSTQDRKDPAHAA